MDWANDGKGNRNPIVVVNKSKGFNVLTLKARQGTSVSLDASKSYDPDGDSLTFKWWILPEAGTFTGNIRIPDSTSSRSTVAVPSGSAGKTFHVICEVSDNGVHNLTSYRRIIFEIIE